MISMKDHSHYVKNTILLQIKKLKNKRKWKRSHTKEELMPDPTEMAQKKVEEIEEQYAVEKEVRFNIVHEQT